MALSFFIINIVGANNNICFYKFINEKYFFIISTEKEKFSNNPENFFPISFFIN